jgi:hypothetical protein
MPNQPPPKPPQQPPQPPRPPEPAPQQQPPAANVEASRPHPDPAPDGPSIAEEQRRRSDEIEHAGVAKPQPASTTQVPGVVPPTKRS